MLYKNDKLLWNSILMQWLFFAFLWAALQLSGFLIFSFPVIRFTWVLTGLGIFIGLFTVIAGVFYLADRALLSDLFARDLPDKKYHWYQLTVLMWLALARRRGRSVHWICAISFIAPLFVVFALYNGRFFDVFWLGMLIWALGMTFVKMRVAGCFHIPREIRVVWGALLVSILAVYAYSFYQYWSLKNEYDARIEQIRLHKEPVAITDLYRYNLPQSKELSQKFLSLAITPCNYKDSDILSWTEKYPREKYAYLSVYCEQNQPALLQLQEIAKVKNASFVRDWGHGLKVEFPELSELQKINVLLMAKVLVSADQGNIKEALRWWHIWGDIARLAAADGCYISGEQARYVYLMRARVIERIINDFEMFNLPQLKSIIAELDQNITDNRKQWYKAVERAAFLSNFEEMYRRTYELKVFDTHNFMMPVLDWVKVREALDYLNYVDNRTIRRNWGTAFCNLPPLRAMDGKIAKSSSSLACLRTLLGIELYRKAKSLYPPSLDELQKVVPLEIPSALQYLHGDVLIVYDNGKSTGKDAIRVFFSDPYDYSEVSFVYFIK